MKCGECDINIDEGHTYERRDYNMFTRKPMMMLWYVCPNENCGVNLPVGVE